MNLADEWAWVIQFEIRVADLCRQLQAGVEISEGYIRTLRSSESE